MGWFGCRRWVALVSVLFTPREGGDGSGSLLVVGATEMVENWSARLVTDETVGEGRYKVVMEWDHIHDEAVVVDMQHGWKVTNPVDDPRCSGASTVTSDKDGQPYWMPRFNSRAVPAEVTAATGIQFASIDWQPCGHKDITICHAESHYDIHFYYVPEEELAALPMCEIGTEKNPALPVCEDHTTNAANHEYFRLIDEANLPTSYKVGGEAHPTDFCVDPSSAILRSGVHYGERMDTLGEWKKPVTILGSHGCKLLFFEPMISWKWISDNIYPSTEYWPEFEVTEIEYAEKSFTPLPDGWSIHVSEGCRTQGLFDTATDGTCHITLTVTGTKCPQEGCGPLPEKCGSTIKDCKTQEPYASPWVGKSEPPPVVVQEDVEVSNLTALPNTTATSPPDPSRTTVLDEADKNGSYANGGNATVSNETTPPPVAAPTTSEQVPTVTVAAKLDVRIAEGTRMTEVVTALQSDVALIDALKAAFIQSLQHPSVTQPDQVDIDFSVSRRRLAATVPEVVDASVVLTYTVRGMDDGSGVADRAQDNWASIATVSSTALAGSAVGAQYEAVLLPESVPTTAVITPPPSRTGRKKSGLSSGEVLGISASALFLLCLAAFACCMMQQSRKNRATTGKVVARTRPRPDAAAILETYPRTVEANE